MKDRRLVEPIDDLRLDKEGSSIRHTNDELDANGDKERQDDTEDQKPDCRQKQKNWPAPNSR